MATNLRKLKAGGEVAPPPSKDAADVIEANPRDDDKTPLRPLEVHVPETVFFEFSKQAGREFGFTHGAKKQLFLKMWKAYKAQSMKAKSTSCTCRRDFLSSLQYFRARNLAKAGESRNRRQKLKTGDDAMLMRAVHLGEVLKGGLEELGITHTGLSRHARYRRTGCTGSSRAGARSRVAPSCAAATGSGPTRSSGSTCRRSSTW